MTTHNSETEIRELTAEEVDAATGALKIHIRGLFFLKLTEGDVSIGVLGHGVGYSTEDGAYNLRFN